MKSHKDPSSLLIIVLCMFILSSCQQDEFYDKPILKEYYGTNEEDKSIDDTEIIVSTPTPVPTAALKLVEDNFEQNEAGQAPIDIIWIIDNSGSMQEEQDNLAANFSAFIDQFISRDLDFQMTVITTDPNDLGMTVCDQDELNDEVAKIDGLAFKNKFSECVKVGISGSGNEQGFTNLENHLMHYSNVVLRPQAYLTTIFLSDEEEHSSNSASQSIQKTSQYLDNQGFYKAFSIVTENPINKWEEIGKKYMDVATLSGGSWSSIHGDFAANLSSIGGTIANMTKQFPLAQSPLNLDIKISINGIAVKTGWSYQQASNSVQFDDNAIPAAGTKIKIQYYID